MKCDKCPLFAEWNNKYYSGAYCGVFGDDWDNILQYEDEEGKIIGCYVESAFIKKRKAGQI